jgi:MFS family permease
MQSSLLAAIVPAERRHTAFAQQRVAANLGLGLGGAAAGLLVSVTDPQTFSRLFLFNGATFLVYACFVARLPEARPGPRPASVSSRYRAVLADRALADVALLTVLLVAAGVSLFASLFPVYAHNDVGVSERTIGVLFLLNSLLIIVLQLPIARAHEGRRRMRGLALTATAFGATWLLTLAGPRAAAGWATALLVVAVLVFAVGECVYDVVQGPLVADLAEPHARGRYMAVSGFAWQLGFIAGPGLGGLLLSAAGGWLWAAAAATCFVTAGAALRLEHRIPTRARRTAAIG